MKLENLKLNPAISKLTGSHLFKQGKAVLLASTIAITTPQVASANVDSENIFRDKDAITMVLLDKGYTEESDEFATEYDKLLSKRKEQRLSEEEEIAEFFDQDADNERLSEINEAIEIADKLEELAPNAFEYLSTSKEEVLSLDIPALYDEMQVATINNDEETFKNEHLSDLAALNAYTYLSTGTIKTTLTNQLSAMIIDYVASQGKTLTSIDATKIDPDNGTITIEYTTDYGNESTTFDGKVAEKFITSYQQLSDYYKTGLEVISSDSHETQPEDTFLYNGVDISTGTSAWLALSDYEVKKALTDGLSLIDTLSNSENYNLEGSMEDGNSISITEGPTKNF